MSQVRATLLVNGPRQLLRALRKRVVEGLATDWEDVRLRQAHQEDQLEFIIESARGLPYPLLIAASARYPDCVLTLNWEAAGVQGVTTVRNGEVQSTNTSAVAGEALSEAIDVDAEGTLRLGLVLASADARLPITGYAATRSAEAYFRISGSPAEPILQTTGGDGRFWDEDWSAAAGATWTCSRSTAPQAIGVDDLRALEDSAASFRARWLWYDRAPQEETAIERRRAGDAARPVNPINVQSRSLARLAAGACASIAPQAQWVVALLTRSWAAADL